MNLNLCTGSIAENNPIVVVVVAEQVNINIGIRRMALKASCAPLKSVVLGITLELAWNTINISEILLLCPLKTHEKKCHFVIRNVIIVALH